MERAASCARKNGPLRFVAKTVSQLSSVASSRSLRPTEVIPALLTSTSSRPKCRSVFAISDSRLAVSATLALIAIPWLPAFAISATTCAAASALEWKFTTTACPSRARRSAIARPMPREAPVTTATGRELRLILENLFAFPLLRGLGNFLIFGQGQPILGQRVVRQYAHVAVNLRLDAADQILHLDLPRFQRLAFYVDVDRSRMGKPFAAIGHRFKTPHGQPGGGRDLNLACVYLRKCG